MQKRTAALTVLLALTLSGCAGGPESAPSEPVEVAESAAETVAPLVAEEPDQLTSEDASDEQFLAYVRDNLLPETQVPNATDEQLIAAGRDACEQLESGVAYEDVRVVEGEQPHSNGNYYDSSAIMNGAVSYYCTEYR